MILKFKNKYYNFFTNKNEDYSFKKWILFILLIKLTLFVFYTIQFHIYPEISLKHGLLYVIAGDTFTYYPPMISFLTGHEYGNACRMPGLFPVFGPLYFFSKNLEFSYNAVIVIQFIISTISVYVLGLISLILFKSKRIFILTLVFYSLFYHIGDHFLLADSIGNSALIFATYFFIKSLNEDFNNKKYIFFSGLFFTWSIFARVIVIVPFTVLCLFILFYFIKNRRAFVNCISLMLLFTVSFLIFESGWVIRNKLSLNRIILFTVPECYHSFSYNWLELNKVPTAWGLETTHWIGEIDWLLNKKSGVNDFPYTNSIFTKSFNADSITKLKNEYHLLSEKGEGLLSVSPNFKSKVDHYISEYKSEHFMDYYVFHPLKLLYKFHYKKMIVDMPFPKFSEMNLIQKGIKFINWFVLLVISLAFLFFAPISLFVNKDLRYLIFLAIPFSISFFLGFIFGAIEQRYFWPVLPFAIVFFAWFLDLLFKKVKSKKSH